jgi:hypothetical protein
MSLDELRVLLHFKDAPDENCAVVNDLLDEHIGHVSARIRELRWLQAELRGLREQCRVARDAGHCGILNELPSKSSSPRSASSHVGRPLPHRWRPRCSVPARRWPSCIPLLAVSSAGLGLPFLLAAAFTGRRRAASAC